MLRHSAAVAVIAVSASCVSVQDYGREELVGPGDPDAPDAPGSPPISAKPTSDETWRWEWVNPAPTGNTLVAVGGTSDKDLWVAGDSGAIFHFNGVRWDIRHLGKSTVRYFAIGAQNPDDVWVAGIENGKISAAHFDGKAWLDSYPFAGGAFTGFSHGTGKRLFAVVDSDILELGAGGKWTRTDTKANDVFGAPVDVWVSSSGEAWALTRGAKLLHLPAASPTWELVVAPAGVPPQARGVALSGAGTKACAFYTGSPSGAGGGTGLLSYDGSTWKTGPASATALTTAIFQPGSFGARSACLDDGSAVLLDSEGVIDASPTSAPSLRKRFDYQGEKLLGALSLDGSSAYVVGTLGGLLTRSSGQPSWRERGPTTRKDLMSVDVGLDGTTMLIDALQPDPRSGGEVLYWHDDALALRTAEGFAPPSLPVAVAVVGTNDAWVLVNSPSSVGVNHWTGAWGLTKPIAGSIGLGSDPLAIWASGKDDVWVTGQDRCPDLDPLPSGCSKPQQGYVWHHDGKSWQSVKANGVYRSIHGTSARDVWFAGTEVAHWDGAALAPVASLGGGFTGVWAGASGRVWLWGDHAVLYDGHTTTPVGDALHSAAEWDVTGIAESSAGDVFVLTGKATGTSLLWFDPALTRLVEQIDSDLELTTIRGRGDQLWAVGKGGASLRFAAPVVR